nr:hypothetical protein [Streptomyces luteolifulvus]
MATKLFVHHSGDRIVDRTVDRVQVARTVLGVLATLALILVYGVDKDRWGNAAEEGFANAIVTPLLLICTGPLAPSPTRSASPQQETNRPRTTTAIGGARRWSPTSVSPADFATSCSTTTSVAPR